MNDPRAHANGNLTEKRIDLMLIASLVEHGTRVLDIGCGNGELMELLVAERGVDARGLELSQQGVNACVARGLAVVQGNADTDLSYYPDRGFDTVILSQTLQATQRPKEVLQEMSRIGNKLIVSIPNFGHWRIRLALALRGRMPETQALSAKWYDTANIHLCSMLDLIDLCDTLSLRVETCLTVSNGKVHHSSGRPSARQNLMAELVVFELSH
ncbi:MAG: methionine biosynthesis protein MetW [Rhizobiales bacterium TMED83]|jgi:methionine biosynthesis protein MetW|nr:methionine biosynthesis protein MetW [Rhodobiaceae bacterium]RPF93826.1 MAG: methionine biosynthesis protein MetW [Rhizobiales bacterium TMED83]HCD16773.1 methionine biosynthesis protein MetW [Rhodobiaceae bacterium]|tara:strand:- start:247 stop:885 length:639 start_codon:yes stop_codon:yes gene_type:complete